MTLDFKIARAPLQFECWLTGSGRCRIHGLEGNPLEMASGGGRLYASYMPETWGQCYDICPGGIEAVGLQVDPALFHEMLGEDVTLLPSLYRISDGAAFKEKFTMNRLASPGIVQACQQIAGCPLHGVGRRLYLEGKALELLSLIVEAHQAGGAASIQNALSSREASRIHDAREILLADLKHPPSIAALARETGINETKLKRGFKELYGVTIFECLRKHKMEMARIYLNEKALNVSEAAWEVGYCNVSHFIRAYRNQFGESPGQQIRKGKGRYV
ncbi:MAG: AraC family transcriptional regulator [Desulfobacterales bacterium]|nr:AraC family transcriptional regulator [Desulfobacterales bacterium]